MTALAGLANSFWQLFTARMGVGIGEASLGPASTSMLADYFDEHRLPFAYGIVASAPFIGTGLANIVGGPLIDYLEAQPKVILPFFWRNVFLANCACDGRTSRNPISRSDVYYQRTEKSWRERGKR